jgi:hypothetical protein
MKSIAWSKVLSSVIAAVVLTIAGCGGKPISVTPTNAAYPAMSGNYQLTATSTAKAGVVAQIGGGITQSSGFVSGVVHVLFSDCYNFQDDLAVTGTVKTDGTLTLTSSGLSGQVLTVKAKVSTDGSSITSGTYSIAGGCADKDTGTIVGGTFPLINGTYKGIYTTPGKSSVQVTAQLTQSPTPDAHGFFHVSGATTFVGSTCFSTGAIMTPATDSLVAGSFFGAILKTNETSPSTVTSAGSFDTTGKTLTGGYTVIGGACAGDTGPGSLARQ